MSRRRVTIVASDGKTENLSWYDGATEAAILRCARLALGLGLGPDPDLDPGEKAHLVWQTGDVVDFSQPVTDGVTLYLNTTIAPPRGNVYGGYGGNDSYGGYTGSLNPPRFPFGEGGGDVIARGRSSAGRVRSPARDEDQERSGWEKGRSSSSLPASSSCSAAMRGNGRDSASGSGGGGGDSSSGHSRRLNSKSDAPKTLIRRWLRRGLDSSSRRGGSGGGGSTTGFNPSVDHNSSDEERRPLLNAATRSPSSRRDRPATADKGGWGWDWCRGAGWDWGAGSGGDEGGGGEPSRSSSPLSSLLARCRGGEREETGANEVHGYGYDGEQQRRTILKMKRMLAHLANERTFLAWVRVTGKMFTAGVLSLSLATGTTGSYNVVLVGVSLVYFALCPYIVFIGNSRFHKVADVMQGSVHDAYAFFTGRHLWGIIVLLSVLAGLTLAAMVTEVLSAT